MTTAAAAPTRAQDRITSLDLIRGVAVLGILLMNVVSFALPEAAYANLDASGSSNWLDWLVGGLGELFVDQRFMGLFSLLFGAGIVLFADRAEAKGDRPLRRSLWRNLLLLGIGVLHTLLWEGDVLVVYALCAPVLLAVRRWPPRRLVVLSLLTMAATIALAVIAQSTVGADGSGLGTSWFVSGPLAADSAYSDEVGLFFIADAFLRALSLMLLGVVLHRSGFLAGGRPVTDYQRLAVLGLGTSVALSAVGLAWQVASGFDGAIAIASSITTTLGTIPGVCGYLGLLLWWDAAADSPLKARLRAAGRMALTNYLAQTVIGVLVWQVLLDGVVPGRAVLLAFVLAVWALQLWWSPAWLARYRFGPAEWAWRTGTYRRRQPLRRPAPVEAGG